MNKLTVVSLCDGISIGRLALEQLGYDVDYYRAEIKETANKLAMERFPDSHNLGDVTKVGYKNGILYSELGNYNVGHIDMVMFGSPCQNFSRAMHTEDRIGLEGSKSSLFYQCLRILKECQPDYYFMENVIMKKEDQQAISDMLGVEPVRINGSYFTAALRDRLYWANWDIKLPENHGANLQSILTDGYTNRDRARALLCSDSRPLTTPVKMAHRFLSSGFTTLIFKDEQHYKDCVAEYKRISGGIRKLTAKDLDGYDGDVFDGVRYMNQVELERCQGVPEGYTSCLTRNEASDTLGDSWCLPVIKWCFSFMKTMQNDSNLEETI